MIIIIKKIYKAQFQNRPMRFTINIEIKYERKQIYAHT